MWAGMRWGGQSLDVPPTTPISHHPSLPRPEMGTLPLALGTPVAAEAESAVAPRWH